MQKYVRSADPKDAERFITDGPAAVVAAMRQVAWDHGLCGTHGQLLGRSKQEDGLQPEGWNMYVDAVNSVAQLRF